MCQCVRDSLFFTHKSLPVNNTHTHILVFIKPTEKINTFGSLPRDPPDRTSLSSLSIEGEGTLDLGLPGREHSEPASKESSWFSISSSRTHLWQTLCWQGRIRGCVNSSLQIGQISSLSMFLIGTWWWRHGDVNLEQRLTGDEEENRRTAGEGRDRNSNNNQFEICLATGCRFLWFSEQ